MNELAKALLALSWSDMDDFADYITDICFDDSGSKNEPHEIAQLLVDWANSMENNDDN